MFAFLGGTFGNIERYERRVLETIRSKMGVKDIFLIDVFIKSEKYDAEKDPRKDMNLFGEGQRKFLSYAISQRTGEQIATVVDSFEERILFEESHSEVPGSYCFNIKDRMTNSVVTPIRRFDLRAMEKWLTNSLGFSTIGSEEVFISGAEIGRGFILLKASNN